MELENEYLEAVLEKYKIFDFQVKKVKSKVTPLIQEFFGPTLSDIVEMGSWVQKTAIRKPGADVDLDLMISLHNWTPNTLEEIHKKFFDFLKRKGMKPEKRNISMKIIVDGVSVDFVPAIKSPGSDMHTVYSRKSDIYMESNPRMHVNIIKSSGRQREIKLVKLWIHLNKLEFESFLAALVTIEALKNEPEDEIASNFTKVLEYLRDSFMYMDFVDPANSKDSLSRHHSDKEKKLIKEAAEAALQRDLDKALY
jgi:hypothetical protein